MRKLMGIGLLLCACGSAENEREAFMAPASSLPDGVAGTAPAAAGSSSAGSSGAPSLAGAAGLAVAGSESEGGTNTAGSAGQASSGAGGVAGAAGSTSGGTAGQGGTAGTKSEAGSAGAADEPKPFACHDPKPDDGISWQFFTIEPGHCLNAGDTSWSGERVCRETSPYDGVCDATCANYLSVRVPLFGEPITIAVMPFAGLVFAGTTPETSYACSHSIEGVGP
jgi:hypothetical protein